jgi:RecJ-like exonuclease
MICDTATKSVLSVSTIQPTRDRARRLSVSGGRVDLYREDPILNPYGLGKKYRKCRRCGGHGHLHWCPECGENLNDHDDLRTARRDLRDYD